jgi:bifunctional DNA-binding transcriptional regulator/antitoxin component of YhaV-PrlF toxin-antitoxin module
MTYKEAVRLKSKQVSKFEEDGITYKVFVTPEKDENLRRYLTDIRGFYCQLTDSVAKKYSDNGQFVLRGLCYKNKGPNIVYRQFEAVEIYK